MVSIDITKIVKDDNKEDPLLMNIKKFMGTRKKNKMDKI
jgi:hypothetical protein